jgi:hypothetical protein
MVSHPRRLHCVADVYHEYIINTMCEKEWVWYVSISVWCWVQKLIVYFKLSGFHDGDFSDDDLVGFKGTFWDGTPLPRLSEKKWLISYFPLPIHRDPEGMSFLSVPYPSHDKNTVVLNRTVFLFTVPIGLDWVQSRLPLLGSWVTSLFATWPCMVTADHSGRAV